MTDTRVTSVIEPHLHAMKSHTSVHDIRARDAGAKGVATKLFIAFLFSEPEVGV